MDPPILHRLPQRFEDVLLEMGELVKKEDPPVGQGHFTDTGTVAPSSEDRRGGGGMVRTAKRTPGTKIGHLPVEKLMLGHCQHLRLAHRRQNIGEPLGDHTLPAAGASLHQIVVHPRRGDQRSPFGQFLPLDLSEILRILPKPIVALVTDLHRLGPILEALRTRRGLLVPSKAGDRLLQGLHREEIDTGNVPQILHRLRGHHRPADQPLLLEGEDEREEERTAFDPPIKPQLSENIEIFASDLPPVERDKQGDGQVEVGPALLQIAGSQIDGDFQRGKGKVVGLQGGFDPFPGFLDIAAGQAHDAKTGQAFGKGRFDIDATGLYALERSASEGVDDRILLSALGGVVFSGAVFFHARSMP